MTRALKKELLEVVCDVDRFGADSFHIRFCENF